MRTSMRLSILPAVLTAMSMPAQAQEAPQVNGLRAQIRFEHALAGYLSEINGRYKLRVTELVLAPGGTIGEHHHVGPGIRLVTDGELTYILPDTTIVYGPGDYYFEAGDVTHRAENRTDKPVTHLLFEILPVDLAGPSLIRPRPAAP